MSKLNFTARIIGKTAGTARRLVLGSQPVQTRGSSLRLAIVNRALPKWAFYKMDEIGQMATANYISACNAKTTVSRANAIEATQTYLNWMQAKLDVLREKK